MTTLSITVNATFDTLEDARRAGQAVDALLSDSTETPTATAHRRAGIRLHDKDGYGLQKTVPLYPAVTPTPVTGAQAAVGNLRLLAQKVIAMNASLTPEDMDAVSENGIQQEGNIVTVNIAQVFKNAEALVASRA